MKAYASTLVPIEDYKGDSIVFIPNYWLPSSSTQPFSLNSVTGEILWIPDTEGYWVSSYLVKEYRNGIQIGEIRRDMEIIVIGDPTNTSPAGLDTTTNSLPKDSTGKYAIEITPNVPFHLTVSAKDNDNDLLLLSANGEPFTISSNPAHITNGGNGFGSAIAGFSWTPTAKEGRSNPYIVAFRVSELHGSYTLNSDVSLLLNVAKTKSVNVNTIEVLYPNPTSDEMNLQFHLAQTSDVKIIVKNILGQTIKTLVDAKILSGKNVYVFKNLKLPEGTYFVSIMVNDKFFNTKKIVIVK